MGSSTSSAREFWRGVLLAGGLTAVPRWVPGAERPAAGVVEHEAKVPESLLIALSELADEFGVPLSSVLLATHVKVLAALSGAREVTTGYLTSRAGVSLPCRVGVEPGSWLSLLHAAVHAESVLLAYQECPLEDLRRELGVTGPLFETVFEPNECPDTSGDGVVDDTVNGAVSGPAELAEDAVFAVGLSGRGSQSALRLRYRSDVLDDDAAARVAGYHLSALALLVADPEADHDRQSLLDAEERHFQLDGLAGAHRELPNRRVHELFERRVAAHPDAVAAVHGQRRWTYRELNAQANRLARALLGRGLSSEGVVAVVTERNLDWLASVLAVFKAGGVYLPIEPHFPPERIATTLTRAGCEFVLTEAGSRTNLTQALRAQARQSPVGVQTLLVDAVYQAGDADDAEVNPGVQVAPDQLAYIYFTSGSTGEPKGAMCEHEGMLNHLYAKIDDLRIGEGQVVAQTAPQCFDISLWQLVSALLVGGQTLLVEQDVILDVARFVDTVEHGRVGVVQVVPSYLEVVLSYLEQNPRQLPALRYVSVTGEALKKELTTRWFAAQPGIKLVNAYGLTETSDDTNHEVMDRPPAQDRVPLGPPVNNVRVYVVDEHLQPVPLGAPGEIVFSGVCVGRGYVNDPERTRTAFLADPHRTGQRLYRGGDYGRWLPDGKLEFLGRRDTQVKLRGFRIEIGEIENTLLRVAGVRDGAVVVAGRGESKQLVGFYRAARALPAAGLRERLGESLPEYMVPAALHWRETLPLTANSKIDRKALAALAVELDDLQIGQEHQELPSTATERGLAAAWAQVLSIPSEQVGRRDHFFDRGGTSLSGVKLVIALHRVVSLKDLTAHPILTDLAELLDSRTGNGRADETRAGADRAELMTSSSSNGKE